MKNRNSIVTIVLMALCAFALWQPAPNAFGVAPPPDGGYPGFNTAEGENALFLTHPDVGVANSAFGWYSLFSDTDGSFNTALGAGALVLNNGDSNTAAGAAALLLNTTGIQNTAVGTDAMVYNDTGNNNTAVGAFAIFSNIEGVANTATGAQALYGNTVGSANVAIGDAALFSNTIGNDNTAIGTAALLSNTTGHDNTAIGRNALFNNTTGPFNVAHGGQALFNNTMGIANVAIGDVALFSNTTGGDNTAIGSQTLMNNTTGSSNTAIGIGAGSSLTTGNGNVYIGEAVGGASNESNQTYIRNINTTIQDFSPNANEYVTVRLSDGRLGHTFVVSSRRYKEDIKPLAAVSEALYALKPVSFRLKKQYDETQALGFGLIAEEVEKVNPALVYRNDRGQVQSVRYEMVNAMLLNEFLKEHRKVEEQACEIQEQKAIISGLKKEMQTVVARLKEQDSQIQKVSARLEASMPTWKVAATKP